MMIQKLRLKRAWSQQQLAEFSGLSVRTIQRIEAGQPPQSGDAKVFGCRIRGGTGQSQTFYGDLRDVQYPHDLRHPRYLQ